MATFDRDLFGRRLAKLYDSWKTAPDWGSPRPSALAVVAGKSADEMRYRKTTALHMWLFTYELPDTVMVFTPTELHILASPKKVALLEPLVEPAKTAAGITLTLYARAKGEAGSGADAPLVAALSASGSPPLVGTLPKDVPIGAVGEGWVSALAAAGLATTDVSPGVAAVLAVKDAAELAHAAAAGALAAGVLTAYVVPEVERVIDEDRPVKHAKLALRAERVAADPASKGLLAPADPSDAAYPPTICSGGVHDLKLAAPPDDRPLSADAVTVGLGARVACYCANVGRTYLVDPDAGQEAAYKAALAAHEAAVAALVDGAPLPAPRAAAEASLRACEVPALASALGKSVGWGIGLELRESALSLTAAAAGAVAAGMVFNVTLAFNNLPAKPGGKPWAILLADTVIVEPAGAPPRVVTAAATKAWGDIAYELDGDEEEEEADAEAGSGADEEEAAAARAKTRGGARADEAGAGVGADRDRAKAGQDALVERINQETLDALKGAGGGGGRAARGARLASDVAAYASPDDVPAPPTARVAIDGRAEAVLVPFYGGTLPIHVLAVKNATHTLDGGSGAAIIRLALGAGAGYEPCARFPDAVAIKELAFRVADGKAAARVVAEIKALRASVAARDRERAERATLVAQEKLVKAAGRAPTLPDVWVRPPLGGKGRRVTGTLEAHANGFRYASPKGDTLDVMYRNIKFAFFQPAEGEAITLVHFHLHNPIMVGKKKAVDIQFYTEVVDAVQTLDGGRRSAYDPDEIEEEQRERELRERINRAYQSFVRRVQSDVWEKGEHAELGLEFEVPFRELGFTGVPHRSASFMQPTVNCLVELIDMPFTVISLADIIVVNLERVGFGLRNFDMTLVKRDLSEAIRIDAIPMKSLDTVKEWMHSIDIKYYESKINLQWPAVLKSIREDPDAFLEAGGWDFLEFEGGDDGDDDSEDGDAEFAPSGSDSSDDDDDSGSDASVESEEEDDDADGDGDADLSDDEKGMDWEELEQEAARADRKHAGDESDGDGRKGKKGRR